jgi:ribonuclease Z
VDLDVVFLGTSGSTPTARRAPSATLIRRGGERLLFDCAEGTQRQLLRSKVGLPDLEEIFLTHYHADHYLGLPGMLKTFALRGREVPVSVFGPSGLEALFGALWRLMGRLTFDVRLHEVGPGESFTRDGYELRTFAVNHGGAGVGYALVEDERPGRFDEAEADALGVPFGPERGALQRGEAVTLADGTVVRPEQLIGPARRGRIVVLSGDTAPSEHVVAAAQGADLLVHEATFCDEERERAVETLHSTAGDAAAVALAAGVSLLALTHLSNRYFGPDVEREARAVFANTIVPKDFDVVEIPFPERGGPEHRPAAARGGRPALASRPVTRLVQVAVAGDVTEAEEIQALLEDAGIEASLEPAVDRETGVTDPEHVKVLVPESEVETARDAIEALGETDELDETV